MRLSYTSFSLKHVSRSQPAARANEPAAAHHLEVLIQCSDQLAQLTHMMACIDQDNWMTDVLHFKTSMFSREIEKSSRASLPLKHYAAVV
jgi:hypothetical protein